MAVHDLLRELVQQRGRGVVDDADQFRAALDDFLGEDEASTGELNLLVDAVRLGAARRLTDLLEHGGDVETSLDQVAAELARDRGADSASGARWALGALMFALGHAEAWQVGTLGLPPPELEPEPAVESERGRTSAAPATEVIDLRPEPLPATAAPTPRAGRNPLLVAAAVVAVLIAAGAVSAISGRGPLGDLFDDSTPASAERSHSSEATSDGLGAALPDDDLVLPVTGEDGIARLYRVDVGTGDAVQLTDGPDDRLATVSPDRSTVVFLRREAEGEGQPVPMRLDVATGEVSPFFHDGSPCEYGARPAYNAGGHRVVIECLDSGGGNAGVWLLDADAQPVRELSPEGVLSGAFTWDSDSTLIYPRQDDPAQPATLWEYDLGGDVSTQLTDGSQGSDEHPDWSEEQGVAVFTRNTELVKGPGELWTYSPSEGETHLDVGETTGHPAWSPDGARIALVVGDDDAGQLGIVSYDDPTSVTPIDLPGDAGAPAWGSR